MIKKCATILVPILAGAASEVALAYVGPGAGLSLIGALWGLLVAVIAALAFVIVWPIRRMRRQRSAHRRAARDNPGSRRDDGPREEDTGREASL